MLIAVMLHDQTRAPMINEKEKENERSESSETTSTLQIGVYVVHDSPRWRFHEVRKSKFRSSAEPERGKNSRKV